MGVLAPPPPFFFFAFPTYRISHMDSFMWPHVKSYGNEHVVYNFYYIPFPGPPSILKSVPPFNLNFFFF